MLKAWSLTKRLNTRRLKPGANEDQGFRHIVAEGMNSDGHESPDAAHSHSNFSVSLTVISVPCGVGGKRGRV